MMVYEDHLDYIGSLRVPFYALELTGWMDVYRDNLARRRARIGKITIKPKE